MHEEATYVCNSSNSCQGITEGKKHQHENLEGAKKDFETNFGRGTGNYPIRKSVLSFIPPKSGVGI